MRAISLRSHPACSAENSGPTWRDERIYQTYPEAPLIIKWLLDENVKVVGGHSQSHRLVPKETSRQPLSWIELDARSVKRQITGR